MSTTADGAANVDNGDIRPEDSVSQVAGSPSTISSTTRCLELSAKRAALEAEAAFAQQQQAIELEELRQRKQALDLKVRIATLKAEEQTYAQGSVVNQNEGTVSQSPRESDVVLNPRAPEWQPQHPESSQAILQRLTEQGQQQQRQLLDAFQLPTVRIPDFDGDPLKYFSFIRLFEANVERDSVDSSSRLARLMQYCTGKARQVIAGCAVMSPDEGYSRAKALLKSRFGNEYTIAEAWIDKVCSGPGIKPMDRQSLQNLADDLVNCYDTLKAMACLSEVNNQKTLVKIIERLPAYLQHRWRKQVSGIRRATSQPNFEHVVTFARQAAEEVNDPVYGINESEYSKRRPHRQVIVNTASAGDFAHSEQARPHCPMCSEQHSLFKCQAFKSADVQNRRALVRNKKLCYNCLRPGHRADVCNVNRTCSVPGCNKKHTKFLHSTVSTSAPNHNGHEVSGNVTSNGYAETDGIAGIQCGLIGAGGVRTALPIVAVHVRNPDTQAETKTYALLDSGSTHSFCAKNLVHQLNLKGDNVSLSLTTLEKSNSHMSTLAVSIEVSDPRGGEPVTIESAYVKETLPISLQNRATIEDVQQWRHLQDVELPAVNIDSVGLLIGQDAPEALIPLEIRRAEQGLDAPYATRTVLGWSLNGPLGHHRGKRHVMSSFIHSNASLEHQVEKFWKLDAVPETEEVEDNLSVCDKRTLSIWRDSIQHCEDGHYEVAVPFMQYPPALVDNIDIAKQRLRGLRARLARDAGLHSMYNESMKTLLENEHAEEVPDAEVDSTPVWYLPHHAVMNPNKPGKVRVVFDCSAKHCGRSLNDVVMQGPDLTNKLVGVLMRFRQERIAMMADIQSTFYQVRVTPHDRDLLRFLWWRDGNLDSEPCIYRMKVHIFGGVWSPSCCNFVLRRTAEDSRCQYDPEVIDTVLHSFYVDDCLKSTDSVDRAVCVVQQMCRLMANGGFRLTKWISNNREVMSAIPEEDWSKEVKKLDLQYQALPVERALGLKWDVETDTLSFATCVKEKPMTRRGMLSVVSSVFDPLGFLNPFILPAKRIVQDLCRRKVGWDDQLSVEDEQSWTRWLKDLRTLDQLRHSRCLKPVDFGIVAAAELHHFSDASRDAYGAVSYLRLLDEGGKVHCSFVISKSRVAPLRVTTIPRLELCAAVLAAQLDHMIHRELDIKICRSVFWTDSTVVLQYIQNEHRRFHTFVANRISAILTMSVPSQWRYVNTDLNPADDVSRGLTAEEVMCSTRWSKGPQFLWQDEKTWPQDPVPLHYLSDNDPEVRKDPVIYATRTKCSQILDRIILRRSSWFDLKKDIAYFLRVRCYLKNKCDKQALPDMRKPLTVAELRDAETQIVSYVQRQTFSQDVSLLRTGADVLKSSPLYRLEPVMHDDGLIRVGGRLPSHPVILPHKHAVTDLIIRYFHVRSGHCGSEHTLAQVSIGSSVAGHQFEE